MINSQSLDDGAQWIGDDEELWADLLSPLDGSSASRKPSSTGSVSMDVDLAAWMPQLDAGTDDVELESITSVSADGEPDGKPPSAKGTSSWSTDGYPSVLRTLWEQGDVADTRKVKTTTPVTRDAPPSLLTWTDPASALQQVDAPNADTMDMRRMKNREFMRRARERQREDYKRMKVTVARLEKQYAKLCARAAPGLEDALVALSPSSGSGLFDRHKGQLQQRYAAILSLVKRLRAENLYLKAGLQEHANWKQDLHRILDSMIDPSSDFRDVLQPPNASPASSPVSSPSAKRTLTALTRPMAVNFDVMDVHEAKALFHFSPLDEAAVARVIVDNAHETQSIRSSLMAAAQAKDPRVRHHDVLGWDVIQRVRGTYMEYIQTKTFRDLDVGEAGQQMWVNDMQTDTFRRVLSELRRIEVLQRVSSNVYILGRDIKPFDGNTVFRSVFMRFRTHVGREIPNGSLPPLKATGFAIGSHSLNRDWSSPRSLPPYRSYYPGDGSDRPAGLHDGEPLEWADFVYSTEFLTIEDPSTGETYNQIQWIGRSDFKSQAEALRNAPDALTVCLRTEMLLFRPALQLRAISDGDAR